MKATGIVRRIDDLGRVVIPKEIRRTLRIREGDPLEIFTNTDGGVIFRKYSPVGELSSFAEQYAEVLSKTANVPVLICDSDHVVAAAGVSKKEFLERRVTQAMEDYMQSRQKFVGSEADHALRPIEGIERNASVVYPIIASSDDNIAEIKKVMTAQTIGYDKINQLRHVQFFKNADGVRKHMQILADCLKPKFETVLNTLEKELKGSGLITWENPKGGYFVSVDVLPGCAKRVVELAKEAGVALTGAGATYPYKNDPKDSNLRIAPSYPTVEELQQAMDLFCVCVKKAGIEKLLEED